jgi:hypothetical protein
MWCEVVRCDRSVSSSDIATTGHPRGRDMDLELERRTRRREVSSMRVE